MDRFVSLIEFPADDPDRARRFWSGLLGASLGDRAEDEGEGWQTHDPGPAIGVHPRGRGPGRYVLASILRGRLYRGRSRAGQGAWR